MSSRRTLIGAATFAAIAGTALTANAQTVLFDAGPPKTSWNVSTSMAVLLGFSSGNIVTAGFPQRWIAAPFTLSAGATVTELAVYGFDPADLTNAGLIVGFTDFNYAIWRRNAGNPAPTQADQVVSGTVPALTVGPGQADPRSGFANMMLFRIPVSHSLPAGNYYLTVYGANATTPGTDANFAWFTNAQLDPTLTPPNTPIVLSDAGGVFAWRSASFPTPGFQRYTTTAFTIDPNPTVGPNPQDPQYFYSTTFFISGTPSGPTCYPDCDGSHSLNVNDFVCFQGAFAGGNMALADCNRDNALNVNDFVCFQSAFAAGCSAP